MTWTNTGGGDHEGEDWTPADSLTVGGVHYGIGTFLVTNGWTINTSAVDEFEVYAETITVAGTINGDSRGYTGGAPGSNGNGTGHGGSGSSTPCAWGGGGGAGYADNGGAGGGGGAAGIEYDADSDYTISLGSGGGGPVNTGGAGGNGGTGGGSVLLAGTTISVTGAISCDGAAGSGQVGGGGGGGGSGGGIMLVGGAVTATGTFTSTGGDGADGPGSVGDGGGGGGAGGRIKIFYVTSLDTTGITTTLTAGTGGAGTCANGAAGGVGVYNTAKLHKCTSSAAIGQTFTIGADSASMIEKINVWVTAVNTGGDFVLKVWDSASKSTEYGTKTVTISGTGSTDFIFADWIQIPNGESQYYIEITTAGAGDIELGIDGYSEFAGGNLYHGTKEVSYFDMYYQIYSIDHVKGATVYNTADTTVKSNVANFMLIGAVHRINSDNTGTVQYVDNYSTNKYLADYNTISGVTYSSGSAHISIADNGYITYMLDCKYPITGMPILTGFIDVTAGTPTIQISSDGATWYDIDTAIVNGVFTSYELDNAANLSLKGLTSFYFRFDCTGAGTNTATVKLITVDVNTVTIDVENPVINTGAANTIRSDQDSDSGVDCEVSLIYRDRKWAS